MTAVCEKWKGNGNSTRDAKIKTLFLVCAKLKFDVLNTSKYKLG